MISLLLHSCCAPCSSYVIEYLRGQYELTLFFYNPNITERSHLGNEKTPFTELRSEFGIETPNSQHYDRPDETEYKKRRDELIRLAGIYGVECIEGAYDRDEFCQMVQGYEDEPEGGERCRRCFELRLAATARYAYDAGFDQFTTTLTVSPRKNAGVINEIGGRVVDDMGSGEGGPIGLSGKKPIYLPSDFKKKGGYQRSVELSKEYGLYRQGYCGCGMG